MKISDFAIDALKEQPDHEQYDFCQEQSIPDVAGGYCLLNQSGQRRDHNPSHWEIFRIDSTDGNHARLSAVDSEQIQEISLEHYYNKECLFFLKKTSDNLPESHPSEDNSDENSKNEIRNRINLKDLTNDLIEESSVILENTKKARKEADELIDKLRQLDKEMADDSEDAEKLISSDEKSSDSTDNNAPDPLPPDESETISEKALDEKASGQLPVSDIPKKQSKEKEFKRIKPYKGNKPYLFISYAHRDVETVYPIIQHMQDMGLRIWFDEFIVPGKEWDEVIAQHVEKCDAMIAFLSSNFLKSSNCKDELNYARDLDKDRLLVYIERDVKLPSGMAMRLNRLQALFLDAYPQRSFFYEKLMECPFVSRNSDDFDDR